MAIAEAVHPLIEANAALDDGAKLRAMMEEHGYVYLRGVGPKKRIQELRGVFLDVARRAGWVDPKAGALEAKWSGAGPYGEGDPPYMAVYKEIVNHPLFNELPADPFYMDVLAKLIDGPVFMHRMHIGRITFPENTTQTTPPHQDWQYIRGSSATYTVWTPLGDTPLELGGLKVLHRSHKRGFVEHSIDPVQKYAGWGLKGAELDATGGDEWHTAAYTLGDCVIFHSHTVHGAMPNLTRDTLRMSIDNRYQRQGDPYGPAATRSHHNL